MASLYDILRIDTYPITLKIVSGNLTSEEGEQFVPGEQIVVYGAGRKTYITPEDVSLLRSGWRRELFKRDREFVNIEVGSRMINCFFVPFKSEFKDAHCSQKTSTRVSELFQDKPRYVKVNRSFFAFIANKDMKVKKMNEGKKIELLLENIDTSTSQKGKSGQIIKAKVNDEIIVIRDSDEQLNVDSVLDEQVYDCNFVLNGRFTLPRIMSFCNQEVHQMFDFTTGYNGFVINKFKYAVCMSECLDKLPKQLSGNMSVARGVYCIDEDISNLKKIRVEVLGIMEKLTASFAHDTGIDAEGLKLYDLYLMAKYEQQQNYELNSSFQAPISVPTESPEDSDSSDLGYEEPLPRIPGRGASTDDETPPVPPRYVSPSVAKEACVHSNEMHYKATQPSTNDNTLPVPPMVGLSNQTYEKTTQQLMEEEELTVPQMRGLSTREDELIGLSNQIYEMNTQVLTDEEPPPVPPRHGLSRGEEEVIGLSNQMYEMNIQLLTDEKRPPVPPRHGLPSTDEQEEVISHSNQMYGKTNTLLTDEEPPPVPAKHGLFSEEEEVIGPFNHMYEKTTLLLTNDAKPPVPPRHGLSSGEGEVIGLSNQMYDKTS